MIKMYSTWCRSNGNAVRSFGSRQIGSLAGSVSRRIGLGSEAEKNADRAKFLPVLWKPDLSLVLKTGVIVIVVAAAAMIISRLCKRFLSDMD